MDVGESCAGDIPDSRASVVFDDSLSDRAASADGESGGGFVVDGEFGSAVALAEVSEALDLRAVVYIVYRLGWITMGLRVQ